MLLLKSRTLGLIEETSDVYAFEGDKEDMRTLSGLDQIRKDAIY